VQPLLIPTGHPDIFARLPRRSFLSIARSIHAQEGFRGFFRGLGPTYLRAFPSNASALFIYEGIMRALGAEKVDFFFSFFQSDAHVIQLSLRPGTD
jgi:solute carrier family 25 carnitine/acylcarnitine transporter 20/29